jgi:hypothetical protein
VTVAFELVKVRRQLEYSIAAAKGIQIVKPPGTLSAVRDIVRGSGGENMASGVSNNSPKGITALWTGLRLHFGGYSFPFTVQWILKMLYACSSECGYPIISDTILHIPSPRHIRHRALFL